MKRSLVESNDNEHLAKHSCPSIFTPETVQIEAIHIQHPLITPNGFMLYARSNENNQFYSELSPIFSPTQRKLNSLDNGIELINSNINNPVILDSDSDSDNSICDGISAINTKEIMSKHKIVDMANRINHEIIDLTEDDVTSSYSSADEDLDECPVCLENLADLQRAGILLTITPCHHVMCTLCSREILRKTSKCPLCRQNITIDTMMPFFVLH